jgi:hypothetical protein
MRDVVLRRNENTVGMGLRLGPSQRFMSHVTLS